MIGSMLVGAWLLIHGQCCVHANIDNRNRSPLVDPLTRRSPLEKNFMRFGRASTVSQLSPTYSPNFIELQNDRSNGLPQDLDNNQRLFRFDRGQDNFIRSDRANDINKRPNGAKNNFMRFGRAKDNFMRFGREYIRYGRGNDNFLRFGRSNNHRTDSIDETMSKERRDKALIRLARQRQSDKNDNFMRFGRTFEENDADRAKRSSMFKVGQDDCRGTECQETLITDESDHQPGYCSPIFDPNVILAPEFSLLPQFSTKFKRNKLIKSDNFLRLG